tara:strand:- start:1007 stop:1408 length:402 start_codon:yes stop_codon:yes gene_type:complete
MALIKFANTNTDVTQFPGTGGEVTIAGDLIVDMAVPVTTNGYTNGASSYIEIYIGGTDTLGPIIILGIQMEGDLGAGGVQLITDSLNDAIEAAVADPYGIPTVSAISVPGMGHINSPAVLYPIEGLCTQTTAS